MRWPRILRRLRIAWRIVRLRQVRRRADHLDKKALRAQFQLDQLDALLIQIVAEGRRR